MVVGPPRLRTAKRRSRNSKTSRPVNDMLGEVAKARCWICMPPRTNPNHAAGKVRTKSWATDNQNWPTVFVARWRNRSIISTPPQTHHWIHARRTPGGNERRQNRDEENQRSRYCNRQEPCATDPESAVLQDLGGSGTSQRSEHYSHSPDNQAWDYHHAHDGLGMCGKRHPTRA